MENISESLDPDVVATPTMSVENYLIHRSSSSSSNTSPDLLLQIHGTDECLFYNIQSGSALQIIDIDALSVLGVIVLNQQDIWMITSKNSA